ncbi:alpha/beta hydrolase family esterase [Undibacterium sp. TJN25]|uniref:alpha/beta hydrolase family esterase n=1 Tax=Undibacterium sp. TJN25 TaxID=3413056 RepID=UPI003BF34D6E
MKKLLRFLGYCLLALLGFVALCGALFGYFIYSPDPELPQLSGTLSKGSIEVGGLKRTYLSYVPKGLPKGAPLVLVMHGSGEGAAEIRTGTGYGFERLADQNGFAVVYPDSYSFDWNDCSKVGDFSAKGREVDDVGFLTALVDKLIIDTGVAPGRVFATGVSAGGFMSLRLALEAPSRFRAVAAVSANVPAPENFKCKPANPGTSVMIMDGTKDPLVPFKGGEVNLLGMFYKGGNVRSARESAQYFADFNKIAGAPATMQNTVSNGNGVEHLGWHNDGKAEVEFVAIHGGGHGIPQPYWRRPRLLGPSPMEPNGPEMIWAFFARQQ